MPLKKMKNANLGKFVETLTDTNGIGGLRGAIQGRGLILGNMKVKPVGGWKQSTKMESRPSRNDTPMEFDQLLGGK